MADGRQRQLIFAGLGLLAFAAAVTWFGMLQPNEPGRLEGAGPAAVGGKPATAERQPSPAVDAVGGETGRQTARIEDARPPASPEASAEKPAEAPAEAAVTPSFDIVRVEPSGESVIAGRAAAGATVELLRNGVMHARVVSDPSGLFAFVPPPLPAGTHEIVLQSIAPDGARAQSRESVTIVLDPKRDAKPLIALAAPDQPTVVLSQPEKAAEPGSGAPAAAEPGTKTAAAPPGDPAAAPGRKSSTPSPTAALGGRPPAGTRTVTAARPDAPAPGESAPSASPPPPASRAAVKIVSVEAEEGGRLFVSGQAAPGATVRLYLNESLIAPGGAGGDGRVSFAIGRGVRPGGYRVRLDDVDPVSGEVKTRAEVEFRVPAPLTVEVPPPPSPSITPPRVASSAAPARPDAVATQSGAPAGGARATAPETTAPSRQSQAAAAPQPPAAFPRQPSESSVAESSGVAAPQAFARPQAAAGDAPMEASPAQGSSARASAGPAAPGTAAPGSSPAPSEATVPAPAPSRGSGSTTVASAAPPPARDLDPATVLIPEVNTAIVGRGDSLWRISRRMYGGGLRYTVIYTANREQIRNPDLIYPGQVFVLPGGAGEAPSR